MNASRLRVRVARKATEALDICTFELVDTEGRTLPPFSAGSHIDVHLGNGLTRQYSLCNDSAESHRYLIGVLLDPASRGGSRAMHETVHKDDILQISSPKNHFPLVHGGHRSILLAGGIGITPILCMAEHLANTSRAFELNYCTRSRERTAFHERIAASGFRDRARFHHDDGPASQRLDIHGLLAAAQIDAHLYVCGPKGFMKAVLDTARESGWPEEQLHYEFFSGDATHALQDASFQVKLASSGRVVDVPPHLSIVGALAEFGIEIPTSCEQGVCGTCLTRVLEGEPDHRDLFLTPQERLKNNQFTPCCSRSKSPVLVLDL